MSDNIEFDENCDPNNPRKIKYEDILAASQRIAGAVVKTPCTKALMSGKLGMDIYMKQERLQFTGCFKERGVRNTLSLLSDEQKKYGVIAATTGNHGVAMSYHTTQLGIPCIIVMPRVAAVNKMQKCERLGAKVIIHGNSLAEAKLHAMNIRREKKMYYVNGYDHPNVIEGQGTIGIEIIEQVPGVEAILVPVGGGSLIAGIAVAAKHVKPEVEVYGIVTEKTCSMVEALRKNERIYLPIDSSIADGLAVNVVGVNTFHTVKGVVDKMVVVKEDWVARALMHIIEDERIVVEGSAAVSIAAILAGLFPNLKGKQVVCVISGGNIDTAILVRALERGMAVEGRLIKFKVTLRDRPGGMAELCSLLSSIGVALRDCLTERAWVKGDVFSVELKVVVETRGWDHAKELVETIKKHYKDYLFQEMNDHTDKLGASARRGPCLAANPICMQK